MADISKKTSASSSHLMGFVGTVKLKNGRLISIFPIVMSSLKTISATLELKEIEALGRLKQMNGEKR